MYYNPTHINRDNLVSEHLLGGTGNDTAGSNNGSPSNIIWVTAEKWYVKECASWGATSSYTYSNITYVDSILAVHNGTSWSLNKNDAKVTSTALNGVSGEKYWLLRFFSVAITDSELKALTAEYNRNLWPTQTIINNGFPLYSLPNLEKNKVLEISKSQSGWVYIDQSSNGNNGTPISVTDTTLGKNNVMGFNGTSSYITSNSVDNLLWTSDNMTFSVWINPNSTQNRFANIFDWSHGHPTNSSRGFAIQQDWYNHNKFYFLFWDWSAFSGHLITTTLTAGKMQLFTIVKNWTTLTHYVNWAITASWTVSLAINKLTLAWKVWDNEHFSRKLNWSIANLTFRNKALSDIEVQQDFYKNYIT